MKAILNQKIARPISVFNWIEDISFLEQLSSHRFDCYTIFVSDHGGFKAGKGGNTLGLLPAIRSNYFTGSYSKKGKSPLIIKLIGSYKYNWKNISYKSNSQYYTAFKI